MHEARGSILIVAGLLALAGCTETGIQDSLGVGKAAPDEGQVRINQALSIPPDLRLPAPSSKTVEYGTPNKVATYKPEAQPVVPEPVDEVEDYVVQEPATTASTAPTEPVKTAEAAATATTTTAAEPPKPKTIDDTYAKYGISKTYADGKPKPQGVLYDELRKAQAAEKRAKDPNYGSIWNMGDVFSDD